MARPIRNKNFNLKQFPTPESNILKTSALGRKTCALNMSDAPDAR